MLGNHGETWVKHGEGGVFHGAGCDIAVPVVATKATWWLIPVSDERNMTFIEKPSENPQENGGLIWFNGILEENWLVVTGI